MGSCNSSISILKRPLSKVHPITEHQESIETQPNDNNLDNRLSSVEENDGDYITDLQPFRKSINFFRLSTIGTYRQSVELTNRRNQIFRQVICSDIDNLQELLNSCSSSLKPQTLEQFSSYISSLKASVSDITDESEDTDLQEWLNNESNPFAAQIKPRLILKRQITSGKLHRKKDTSSTSNNPNYDISESTVTISFDELKEQSKLYQKLSTVHAFHLHDQFTIKKKTGLERGNEGDYVVCGPDEDLYVCPATFFEKNYEKIGINGSEYRKKRQVRAAKVLSNFILTSKQGDLHGKPGDYLVQDLQSPDDQWIVEKDIFESSYILVGARTAPIFDLLFSNQSNNPSSSTMNTNIESPNQIDLDIMDGTFSILPESTISEVKSLLNNTDKWDFDIFHFDSITKGRPLIFLSLHFFDKLNILSNPSFHISKIKLIKFLNTVEHNYLPNPYHNNIHAADVTQASMHFLQQCHLEFYPLEIFSLLLGSIIHDLGHSGTNNLFHINTRSPLSIAYNDKNVLENFHLAASFRIMKMDGCDILEKFSFDQYHQFRKLVIQLILSTDLSDHMVFLKQFQNIQSRFNFDNPLDRSLLLCIIMKCSDLSHPTRPFKLHQQWTQRCTDEFFLQDELEKAYKIPCSMKLDLHPSAIAKSQIGFINFLVKPLFVEFTDFTHYSLYLDNLSANIEEWQKLSENFN